MDPSRARALAIQDAEALAMIGVDFVRLSPKSRITTSAAPSSPRDEAAASSLSHSAPNPERARREQALAEVLARYERDCPHQHFPTDHHCIVFHDGDPCARLMFIGEAPGADEDRIGRPFVGKAGQLLDKMIAGMGLARAEVYIANVLKVRPPDNATPTPEQAELCAPYLYDQIRIVRPEVIVTLGRPATQLLLATRQGINELRGRWQSFPPPEGLTKPEGFETPIPVMPTFHPAFLLRQYTPENKRKVWEDLKLVMARLGLTPTR